MPLEVREIIRNQMTRGIVETGMPVTEKGRLARDRVQELKRLIDEGWFNKIDFAEFAAKSNVSRTLPYSQFKAKYRLSAKQYQQIRRLDEARKYLISRPHWKIKDVAYECGFFDQAQFSRMFKSHFGLSPSEVHGTRKDAVSDADDSQAGTGMISGM